MMWVLLIIVFLVNEPDATQALETYDDELSCLAERDRIRLEMEAAYPGETDYTLKCERTAKGEI